MPFGQRCKELPGIDKVMIEGSANPASVLPEKTVTVKVSVDVSAKKHQKSSVSGNLLDDDVILGRMTALKTKLHNAFNRVSVRDEDTEIAFAMLDAVRTSVKQALMDALVEQGDIAAASVVQDVTLESFAVRGPRSRAQVTKPDEQSVGDLSFDFTVGLSMVPDTLIEDIETAVQTVMNAATLSPVTSSNIATGMVQPLIVRLEKNYRP